MNKEEEYEYECECCNNDYCNYCNPDPIVNLQEKYIESEQKFQKTIGSCITHEDHCSLCGFGGSLNKNLDPVYCKYTFEQLQDLLHPEIDHYRCESCYKLLNIIPRNSSDWIKEPIISIIFGIRLKQINVCTDKNKKSRVD